MSVKLSKVIKELNVSAMVIQNFLRTKGIEIDVTRVNSRIADEAYELLLRKYKQDGVSFSQSDFKPVLTSANKSSQKELKLYQYGDGKSTYLKAVSAGTIVGIIDLTRINEASPRPMPIVGRIDLSAIFDRSSARSPKLCIQDDCLEFVDLHGYSLQGARSLVGSKAHEVIRSERMMCACFIHGIGIHSGPITDDIDFSEELKPILKPSIRRYLDELAQKNDNCLTIYGEHTDTRNEGVVYFMNKLYYEFCDNNCQATN